MLKIYAFLKHAYFLRYFISILFYFLHIHVFYGNITSLFVSSQFCKTFLCTFFIDTPLKRETMTYITCDCRCSETRAS